MKTLAAFLLYSLFLFYQLLFLQPLFQILVKTSSYTDTVGEDSDYILHPRSYTKLDMGGNALPDLAYSWAMVAGQCDRTYMGK